MQRDTNESNSYNQISDRINKRNVAFEICCCVCRFSCACARMYYMPKQWGDATAVTAAVAALLNIQVNY